MIEGTTTVMLLERAVPGIVDARREQVGEIPTVEEFAVRCHLGGAGPTPDRAHHLRRREGVSRGFDLGYVGAPGGLVDGVLVLATFAIDEFPDDVGVAGVLGRFGDHADEKDPQSRVAAVLWPVRNRPWCLQVEFL